VAEYPDYKTEYVQSPTRVSTRKLARKWNVPYATIATRCRREGWVAERKQSQRKVSARQEEEAVESLAEAHARWAKEYRTIQAAGLKALKKLEPRTAGEAARMVDIGIKGERLQREEEQSQEMPQTLRDFILLAKEMESDEE
jgi:hypothetical protein